jgi:hypothetical protein
MISAMAVARCMTPRHCHPSRSERHRRWVFGCDGMEPLISTGRSGRSVALTAASAGPDRTVFVEVGSSSRSMWLDTMVEVSRATLARRSPTRRCSSAELLPKVSGRVSHSALWLVDATPWLNREFQPRRTVHGPVKSYVRAARITPASLVIIAQNEQASQLVIG